IYGAHGYEDRFIQYLSPQWMEMFAHTTSEAKRLGLGVDLTTGTGWPYGGPRVPTNETSGRIVLQHYDVAGGAAFAGALPQGSLQCLHAVGEDGTQIELSDKVSHGQLDWTAPPGKWRLYAVSEVHQVQKVKRAAPGAEGYVLDPFSATAMSNYLADFDRHIAVYHGPMPRSGFHDSYEYYSAEWTPAFFTEFAARRGYDLRAQLPAFFGEGPAETATRVRTDYRETMADLHLAYIQAWTAWNHSHGSLSRDQAHGSPTDLLDIYAAADIPETEQMPFGGMGASNYPTNKFSSSAAHDSGRTLASSESFTWLTDHFQAPLSLVKQAADYLFLTGVNHIFFHGIPYSPAEAPWPGWQFYAAVNFGPYGGLWHDLPEFNAYVTRCQSVLQSGVSANDILLYYNVYDKWETPGRNTAALIIQNPLPASCQETAVALLNRGYAFDYVSDRFLAQAQFELGVELGTNGSGVMSFSGTTKRDMQLLEQQWRGGNWPGTILVPSCHLMPEESLQKLVDLARSGATILFVKNLPSDVPGLGNLEARRAKFKALLDQVKLEKTADPLVQKAKIGDGAFLLSADVDALLKQSSALREPMMDDGLWFVRRAHQEGYQYFIANRGDKPVDRWISLGTPATAAVLLDPRFDNRSGVAALRQADGATQVYLQLLPGESRILRTFDRRIVTGPAWPNVASAAPAQEITGTWDVKFVEGGPELPAAFTTNKLVSWTTRDDAEAQRFAGTARYTLAFDHPAGQADDWVLQLGRVCEAARVKLNGHDVGAVWSAPWRINVGQFLQPGKNVLEIEVTNLAANRVRDLDIRRVNWKYFYDANMNAKAGGRFDASRWPLRDSGLLGPVQLQPVKRIAFP
ncbi:MAG TPA: glycosyl hydrolase, partial [Candidatus Acidoferrum sp.]|nr:glycosyl hydrolase [Candidatus Acidoferrum sp.]